MGGGSKSSSNSSSTTTYKKTTTTNPYVTSVTDNYGTTTTLNDGTAYKSIYDYTNKNMDELLEEYRHPTLDTPTNQALLQNYTNKLNKQSKEALENNIINPLANRNIVQYFSHLETMGYIAGKHYTFNKIEKKMTFANGSEILFKGVDNPEKIKSLNLHWAEIEEASQVSDSAFKQLIGRLRNTNIKPSWHNFRYRLFGHTNPQANKGWIYKRFVESKKKLQANYSTYLK